MARAKKSRKPGQIAAPKISNKTRSTSTPQEGKKKKSNKGRASGSRNNLLEQAQSAATVSQKVQDRRHGSKKKISLTGPCDKAITLGKAEEHKRLIPKFKTPLQELDFIENDKKLQGLLDKLEVEASISDEEQHYVDSLLNRHKILCGLLGMDPDGDDDLENDVQENYDQEKASLEQDNLERETQDNSEDLLDQLDRDFKF
jgi:ribosome assembly protein YihI (activator of Der GTPase)